MPIYQDSIQGSLSFTSILCRKEHDDIWVYATSIVPYLMFPFYFSEGYNFLSLLCYDNSKYLGRIPPERLLTPNRAELDLKNIVQRKAFITAGYLLPNLDWTYDIMRYVNAFIIPTRFTVSLTKKGNPSVNLHKGYTSRGDMITRYYQAVSLFSKYEKFYRGFSWFYPILHGTPELNKTINEVELMFEGEGKDE